MEGEVPERRAGERTARLAAVGGAELARAPDEEGHVDGEEAGREEDGQPHGSPAQARGEAPERERGEGERRRPLDRRPEPERQSGPLPAPAQREREAEREERRGHEIEAELPPVGAHRPERDDCGEPRAEARAQAPDRADDRELEGDHHERVRGVHRGAVEPGLEREEDDPAGRVFRARVVTV